MQSLRLCIKVDDNMVMHFYVDLILNFTNLFKVSYQCIVSDILVLHVPTLFSHLSDGGEQEGSSD